MSWNEVDAEFRTIAETVCTLKELEVLHYAALGYGDQRIAYALNIRRGAVTQRRRSAYEKIRRAQKEGTAA